MNQNLTFAFIGGDPRQIQVITNFAKDGHLVRTFGLNEARFPDELSINQYESLFSCLDGADIVVLPFPYTTEGETIRTTFSKVPIYTNDILRQMNARQILLVGRADEQLKALTTLYNIHYIDYGEREELLIANAIPTVEGALEIAMRETPYTIHGSHAIVLGYGRIGKLLAKGLQALGAETTVAARKQRDLAWIRAQGFSAISFAELQKHIKKYDLIFNTAPAMILDFRILSEISDLSLIIDLASAPGGVDFETAALLHKKTIQALSLPGKVAPITAGNIIKNTIQNILDELGV